MSKFLAVASFHNNTWEHVEQTFKNMLDQTHQDWWLIVGDDFSDDPEFKRRLKRKVEELNDMRILYYPVEKRRELYLYQNLFQHLDYDYYLDLDSDDKLDPMLLELYANHFERYPEVACLVSDYVQTSEEGKEEMYSNIEPVQDLRAEFNFRQDSGPESDRFWEIYDNRRGQRMYGVARAMRKPDVNALPIVKDCKTATDTFFLFWNAQRGAVLNIPRRLFTYIRRSGSDSSYMSKPELEDFNTNAQPWIKAYQPAEFKSPYESIWHVTSAINMTKWLDRVDEFSIWSAPLTNAEKALLIGLYPDKQISFNRKHRNQIVAWTPDLDKSQLDLRRSNKCTVVTFNEDFTTPATEAGFHQVNEAFRDELSNYMSGFGWFSFFRQQRLEIDDHLDDTITTPRRVVIIRDQVTDGQEAQDLAEKVMAINSAGSEAWLIELTSGAYSEQLAADLGTHMKTRVAFEADAFRKQLEQCQPDVLVMDRGSTLMSASTASWVKNNYWLVISSQEISGKNFETKGDFVNYVLKVPIPEVPKMRFYYRNGPELHCDWAPEGADQRWEAQFWQGEDLYWTQSVYKGMWARYSQDWFADWEIRIVEKHTNRLLYTLKADLTQFGVQIDSGSLGDTLSWMGQMERVLEERDHERLAVRCHKPWLFDKEEYGRRHIDLVNFEEGWPENWQCLGVYQEAGNPSPRTKHPRDWRTIPLGAIAADQLGIPYLERRPIMKPELYQRAPGSKTPSVCIATHSTAQAKYWNRPGGWQALADRFNAIGWQVYHVSKEAADLKGVEHITDIVEVAQQMRASGKFIGISSGLSWLAWALDIEVCLISGFTWEFVEMEDCIRIINKSVCSGCWSWSTFDRGDWNWCPQHKGTPKHFECTKTITDQQVWDALETNNWFKI